MEPVQSPSSGKKASALPSTPPTWTTHPGSDPSSSLTLLFPVSSSDTPASFPCSPRSRSDNCSAETANGESATRREHQITVKARQRLAQGHTWRDRLSSRDRSRGSSESRQSESTMSDTVPRTQRTHSKQAGFSQRALLPGRTDNDSSDENLHSDFSRSSRSQVNSRSATGMRGISKAQSGIELENIDKHEVGEFGKKFDVLDQVIVEHETALGYGLPLHMSRSGSAGTTANASPETSRSYPGRVSSRKRRREQKKLLVASTPDPKSVASDFLAAERRNAHVLDNAFAHLLVLQALVAICISVSRFLIDQEPIPWSVLAIFCGMSVGLYCSIRKFSTGLRATRYLLTVCEAGACAAIIHLSGGRIEAHFQIFIVLSFLLNYRDWVVLLIFSLLTLIDHLCRGLFIPASIFAATTPSLWRVLEHATWLGFQTAVLLWMCRVMVKKELVECVSEAKMIALCASLEERVRQRTRLLMAQIEQERIIEVQLTADRRKFNKVVQCSASSIILTDVFGKITFCNKQAMQLFGMDVVGLAHDDARFNITDFDGNAVPADQLPFAQVQACGASVRGMRIAVCIGEDMHKLLVNGETLALDRPGTVLFFRDVTEQEDARMDLVQAKAAAEASTRAKSAFLSSMSHELRTPMNGIVGMVNLLTDAQSYSPLTDEQEEYMQNILSCANLLNAIINEVLDFSKIEYGALTLEQIPYSVAQVLDQSIDVVAGHSHKQLDIMSLVAPDVPQRVMGDPTRLAQLIVNLTNNAIKFTPGGHVVLEVSVASSKYTTEGSTLIPWAKEDVVVVFDGETQLTVEEAAARELAEARVKEESRTSSTQTSSPSFGSCSSGSFRPVSANLPLDASISPVFGVGRTLGQQSTSLHSARSQSCRATPQGRTRTLRDRKPDSDLGVSSPRSLRISTKPRNVRTPSGANTPAPWYDHWLHFEITDTGIGMKHGTTLFQPFAQEDCSTTRKFGGTGLGLAICRKIVGAAGGCVGARSTYGKGTTFWFNLPLIEVNDLEVATPAPQSLLQTSAWSSVHRLHSPTTMQGSDLDSRQAGANTLSKLDKIVNNVEDTRLRLLRLGSQTKVPSDKGSFAPLSKPTPIVTRRRVLLVHSNLVLQKLVGIYLDRISTTEPLNETDHSIREVFGLECYDDAETAARELAAQQQATPEENEGPGDANEPAWKSLPIEICFLQCPPDAVAESAPSVVSTPTLTRRRSISADKEQELLTSLIRLRPFLSATCSVYVSTCCHSNLSQLIHREGRVRGRNDPGSDRSDDDHKTPIPSAKKTPKTLTTNVDNSPTTSVGGGDPRTGAASRASPTSQTVPTETRVRTETGLTVQPDGAKLTQQEMRRSAGVISGQLMSPLTFNKFRRAMKEAVRLGRVARERIDRVRSSPENSGGSTSPRRRRLRLSASPRIRRISKALARCTPRAKGKRKRKRPHPKNHRIRILLAEDNLVNQKVAIKTLELLGYKDVTVVANGLLAVEAYAKCPFDVCLMDWHMPEMDGLEATRAIRKMELVAKERKKGGGGSDKDHGPLDRDGVRVLGDTEGSPNRPDHLIIVALTASVMEGDTATCLAAGMDKFCCKPLRPQVLKEILGQIVCGS